MKVLVTGGAGYIGSHACKTLAAAGHEPVAYDDLSHGHRWAVKWGPLEVGDTVDEARLAEVMARHRPDAVMHFAALTSVAESIAHPARYYEVNTVGSICLLRAMQGAGVNRIVFSSTAAVYGVPASTPIVEEAEPAPINPYGRSKQMVERILADTAAAIGLRATALRYFNAAGADPAGELGEAHDPETHLVPLVLEAARTGSTVTVFGHDYPTPDGTCVRDYIHVTDLARAHVLALEALGGAGALATYNLGTGAGLSVRSIIALAADVTGREIAVTTGPRRPGDPPVLVADPAKARAELGWTPVHSSAREIVETAWAWMGLRQAEAAGASTQPS